MEMIGDIYEEAITAFEKLKLDIVAGDCCNSMNAWVVAWI